MFMIIDTCDVVTCRKNASLHQGVVNGHGLEANTVKHTVIGALRQHTSRSARQRLNNSGFLLRELCWPHTESARLAFASTPTTNTTQYRLIIVISDFDSPSMSSVAFMESETLSYVQHITIGSTHFHFYYFLLYIVTHCHRCIILIY